MLNDAVCFSQVYVVCGFTDLRSGIDKLAALIKAKNGNSPCIRMPCSFFVEEKQTA